MKKYIFLIISNCIGIITFCQTLYLENFDKKGSLENWIIKTNGALFHTDSFAFNGASFKKASKDSFIIFYDTSKKWNYYFDISKKFKAVPCRSVKIKSSLFSMDSLTENMSFTIKLNDKNDNMLFIYSLPLYNIVSPIIISGNGMDLTIVNDSIWQLADSMEISFHFNPANPYNYIERIGVIDEIYLRELLATTNKIFNKNFKIYPNPSQNILNIEIQSISNELNNLDIYNLSGTKVYSNTSADKNITVNTSTLAAGMYIVKIYNKNFVINQKFIKE